MQFKNIKMETTIFFTKVLMESSKYRVFYSFKL